eukprot:Polyplicarium_translucidae@DN3385_c1_g1_i19.p1
MSLSSAPPPCRSRRPLSRCTRSSSFASPRQRAAERVNEVYQTPSENCADRALDRRKVPAPRGRGPPLTVAAVPGETATSTARCRLATVWIARHGLPKVLTDRGPAFIFEEHPQGNGVAESAVK